MRDEYKIQGEPEFEGNQKVQLCTVALKRAPRATLFVGTLFLDIEPKDLVAKETLARAELIGRKLNSFDGLLAACEAVLKALSDCLSPALKLGSVAIAEGECRRAIAKAKGKEA